VATAIDGRMRGYEVLVPKDCVATQSAARNRRAIQHFETAANLPTTSSPQLRLPGRVAGSGSRR
jgi:nicotinamidase-related amidase